MRYDPATASLGGLLQKFKRFELYLRKAGLPLLMAQLPTWLLCLHYCFLMERKTLRIGRIARRMHGWLETIQELADSEKTRSELIDMDRGMRDDLEATKRTLLQMRELCVNITILFDGIGFESRMLERSQRSFLRVIDLSCEAACTLQRALDAHDAEALALLRQMQDSQS